MGLKVINKELEFDDPIEIINNRRVADSNDVINYKIYAIDSKYPAL